MSGFRRVVFDISTLVSAALRIGSVPHLALLQAFSAGEVCASAATLVELEKVLLRPKFDRYQSAGVRREFAAILRRRTSLFSVSEADECNLNPRCRDPKDDQFLAFVRACDADALISSDADLLVLHPWQDVPILTPAAFVEQVSLR